MSIVRPASVVGGTAVAPQGFSTNAPAQLMGSVSALNASTTGLNRTIGGYGQPQYASYAAPVNSAGYTTSYPAPLTGSMTATTNNAAFASMAAGQQLDEETIAEQQKIALAALKKVADTTDAIAEAQYKAQLKNLEQTREHQTNVVKQQLGTQFELDKLNLQSQWNQSNMMRDSEKQQQQQEIDRQALAMSSCSKQHKLQNDMETAMAKIATQVPN